MVTRDEQVRETRSPHIQSHDARAAVVGLLQLGFAGALALRMRNLQIEEAEQFRLLAEENRINVRLISPSRGEIYDRNGIILARNEPSYRITLIEEDAGDVERVLGKLAQLVPMSSEDLERTYAELDRNPSFLPVTVVDRVTWEDVSRSPSYPSLAWYYARSGTVALLSSC